MLQPPVVDLPLTAEPMIVNVSHTLSMALVSITAAAPAPVAEVDNTVDIPLIDIPPAAEAPTVCLEHCPPEKYSSREAP